ncbi:MAG: hypothetical protein IPI09_20385 [Burkholderiales bacterium]|nr:hypothetical protein [Burkholderiales bacterium]
MLRAQAQVGGFDGLLLPGDHAKGMRAYQESPVLQGLVVSFFETLDASGQHKPIGAVCHGVLLAARSVSTRTGHSVLYGRKTIVLTWPLECRSRGQTDPGTGYGFLRCPRPVHHWRKTSGVVRDRLA